MEVGYIPVHSGNAGSAAPSAVMAPPANVIRAPGLKRGKMEEAISDRVSQSYFSTHKIREIQNSCSIYIF